MGCITSKDNTVGVEAKPLGAVTKPYMDAKETDLAELALSNQEAKVLEEFLCEAKEVHSVVPILKDREYENEDIVCLAEAMWLHPEKQYFFIPLPGGHGNILHLLSRSLINDRKGLSQSCLEYAGKFLKRGADYTAKDNEGRTPLHVAAQTKNFNLVHILLEAKSEVNNKDVAGNYPLTDVTNVMKLRLLNKPLAQELLLYGADVDVCKMHHLENLTKALTGKSLSKADMKIVVEKVKESHERKMLVKSGGHRTRRSSMFSSTFESVVPDMVAYLAGAEKVLPLWEKFAEGMEEHEPVDEDELRRFSGASNNTDPRANGSGGSDVAAPVAAKNVNRRAAKVEAMAPPTEGYVAPPKPTTLESDNSDECLETIDVSAGSFTNMDDIREGLDDEKDNPNQQSQHRYLLPNMKILVAGSGGLSDETLKANSGGFDLEMVVNKETAIRNKVLKRVVDKATHVKKGRYVVVKGTGRSAHSGSMTILADDRKTKNQVAIKFFLSVQELRVELRAMKKCSGETFVKILDGNTHPTEYDWSALSTLLSAGHKRRTVFENLDYLNSQDLPPITHFTYLVMEKGNRSIKDLAMRALERGPASSDPTSPTSPNSPS